MRTTLSSLRRAATAALAALALLAPAHAPAAAAPDDSGWQSLLDQYLVRLGNGRTTPAETRFDYEQLYVDEGIWRKKRSDRLASVHARIFSVRPSELDERARLAWAINAYNFLIVERATLLLLVPRRQFQRYERVDQMTSGDGTFFQAKVADVEGQRYSIADFERRFVYGDSTAALAPRRPGDPRIMFALCRGAIGGPSLAPRAFRPESLEAQLDRAAREALALPRMLRWDVPSRQLLASNYLGERLVDFGGSAAGIVPFAEKHAPLALRAILKREKPAGVQRFVPVDARLNQVERAKSSPPPAPGSGS